MSEGRKHLHSLKFTVTPEEIAAYADAIGDPSPVYRDPEAARAAGYEAQIAPPTFSMRVQVGFAQVIAEDEGVAWETVLHGDQEFEYLDQLVAGKTYEAVAFEVDLRGRPPVRFVTIETDITEVGTGELVQRSRSTLVSRDIG